MSTRMLITLDGQLQSDSGDSTRETKTPLEGFILGDRVLVPKETLASLTGDSNPESEDNTDSDGVKLFGVWTEDSEIPSFVVASNRKKAIKLFRDKHPVRGITACKLVSATKIKYS